MNQRMILTILVLLFLLSSVASTIILTWRVDNIIISSKVVGNVSITINQECGNNVCGANENCPADASYCTDNTCYEPTCTNGCGETAVANGETDEEFKKVHEIAQKLKVSHKPARVNSKIEPSYWVEPKVVLEVYADEITKSPIHTAGEEDGVGYALRFPRLVKFRETDKRAEDCTSVDEIQKMYRQQFKKR